MDAKKRDELDSLLSAYLDDELTDVERAEVGALLDSDAGARQLLEELRMTIEAVQSLPRVQASDELLDELRLKMEREALLGDAPAIAPVPAATSQIRMRWLAAAAMIALALTAGYVMWGLRDSQEGPTIAQADRDSKRRETIALKDQEVSPENEELSRRKAANLAPLVPKEEDLMAGAVPASEEEPAAPANPLVDAVAVAVQNSPESVGESEGDALPELMLGGDDRLAAAGGPKPADDLVAVTSTGAESGPVRKNTSSIEGEMAEALVASDDGTWHLDALTDQMVEYVASADDARWIMVEVAGADAAHEAVASMMGVSESDAVSRLFPARSSASHGKRDVDTKEGLRGGGQLDPKTAEVPLATFARESGAPPIRLLETRLDGSVLVVGLEARDEAAMRQWLSDVSSDEAVRQVDVLRGASQTGQLPEHSLGDTKPSRGRGVVPGTEGWTTVPQNESGEELATLEAPQSIVDFDEAADTATGNGVVANRPTEQTVRSGRPLDRALTRGPGGRARTSQPPTMVRYLIRIQPDSAGSTLLAKEATTKPSDTTMLRTVAPTTTPP